MKLIRVPLFAVVEAEDDEQADRIVHEMVQAPCNERTLKMLHDGGRDKYIFVYQDESIDNREIDYERENHSVLDDVPEEQYGSVLEAINGKAEAGEVETEIEAFEGGRDEYGSLS